MAALGTGGQNHRASCSLVIFRHTASVPYRADPPFLQLNYEKAG